ncbi:MAG TPA: hypothetical protein VEH06_09730 [Candidatus Bathyarchaeia archaeon]|nr:hypothetical protein [Candidatus Bathyarchaeia archaeon]
MRKCTERRSNAQIQHLAANVDVTNVQSMFHTPGIPVSGGLALGFLAGFVSVCILGFCTLENRF